MTLIACPVARSNFKPYQAGGLGFSHHPSLTSMTSVMSYQYPAPEPSTGEMDMSQSPYPMVYGIPPPKSPSDSIGRTQDSSMTFNDSSRPHHVLKRSCSTPSVGAPSTSSSDHQSATGPSGEKKRNKLGYHRTSIACSHCRRRKIRCIASPDVQNRCANCIRLKKECSFYPVDQQNTDPKLSSQGSVGTAIPTASSSSSPVVLSGSPVELASHQHQYSQVPVAPLPSMGTPTIRIPVNDYFPPEVKVPSNGPPTGIPYSMRDKHSTNWVTTDANGNPISKTGDPNMAWRSYPTESPINGQFIPFSHASASSATWAGPTAESGGVMGWGSIPAPVRSLSFSGEGLGSQQASQYYHMAQNPPYERQSDNGTNMYSLGVSMGAMGSSSGQSMNPTGSVAGRVVPSSTPIAWQQQLMSQQQQHHMPYPRGGDNYGEWGYSDSGETHHI